MLILSMCNSISNSKLLVQKEYMEIPDHETFSKCNIPMRKYNNFFLKCNLLFLFFHQRKIKKNIFETIPKTSFHLKNAYQIFFSYLEIGEILLMCCDRD